MNYANIPSLSQLKAFEAAARLQSFKLAAAELCISPSAISQQIRLLEQFLGCRLFERKARAIELTSIGETYLREVCSCLAQLAQATQSFRRHQINILRLSTVPFIAHDFAIPAMPSFFKRCPEVELRIETDMGLVDFDVQDVDVALRVAVGPWPGLHCEKLGDLIVVPVCSPAIEGKLDNVEAFYNQPLVTVDSRKEQMIEIFAHAQYGSHKKIITFNTYFETMRAIEQGVGVGGAILPITGNWIKSGCLRIPFQFSQKIPQSLYLICKEENRERPGMIALFEWLREIYDDLPGLPPWSLV